MADTASDSRQWESAGEPFSAQDGGWLPFLDGRVQLCCTDAQLRPIVLHGNRLLIARRLCQTTELQTVLEQWFRQQASLYLPVRLQAWAARMGLQYQRVTIRNPKSRWGSCSSLGSINLNWRLIWVPVCLGDYVLVHELSHLRHMNHSPAFWRVVASFVPEYQEYRRRLRHLGLPW
ncbi:MAG: M48 family metallopeptidase [Magnetococcales bacterium]|nr:M48 family metallopeptidase [Magnetococcales bacterium]MBF0115261.1 M48 family metallopeptidase [Magnetococcales bacterium]